MVTSYPPQLHAELVQLGVEAVLDQEAGSKPFHFGQQLLDIVQHYQLERFVMMGSSCSLISSCELQYLSEILEQMKGFF